MHHIHIFDKKLRTTEIEGVRYTVLNDLFAVAEVTWMDFCVARSSIENFISTELKPLVTDLGIISVDGLSLMPIESTEVLILRAATGNRPLSPFSVLSECARSIVDFWAIRDADPNDTRNVFVMCNKDDQTYRSVIPEISGQESDYEADVSCHNP